MVNSLINSKAIINSSDWAVTLTCDINTFHTRLVFERLKSDNPDSHFFQVAHLAGAKEGFILNRAFSLSSENILGSINISEEKPKNDFKITFRKKSQTWLVAKEKVKAVIEQIEYEALGKTPFCSWGNKSIFSKSAEVFEIYDPLLNEIYEQDPDLFLALHDSMERGGEYVRMDRASFDNAISKVLDLVELSPNEFGYSALIARMGQFVKKVDQPQNNCYTWALDKLRKLHINLEDYQLEKVISVSTMLVKYDPEESAPSQVVLSPINVPAHDYRIIGKFVTYDTSRDKRTEKEIKADQQQSLSALFSQFMTKATNLIG